MFKHILMPTDGSDHSERAIERGIELAKLCGARVTGIHVVPDYRLTIAEDSAFDPALPGKMDEEARARAESFLAFVKKDGDGAGRALRYRDRDQLPAVRRHHQHRQRRHCDLIVMTSRNRKGLVSLIMGSEASRVLHRASIPVLVFRAVMSADHPDKKMQAVSR